MKLTSLLIATLFVAYSAIYGQSLTEYQKNYPQENGVFLNKSEQAVLTVDKLGNPQISSTISEKIFFLNSNAKYYMKKQIGFSSFYSIKNIVPYVYVPNADGKSFKKTKITHITEEDDFDGGIFHDDYKLKSFYYSGLDKGGMSELSYQRIFHDAHFFGSYNFSSYLPVEKTSYTITVPSDMEIAYTLFGKEKEKVTFTEVVKGKVKILTWTAENLKKLEQEDDALNTNYFSTHVVVRIAHYKFKNETVNFLRNEADLYAYYRGFVKDINTKEDQALKKLTDSIIQNHATPDEKVKAIYYWVQDHIKYVAFEDSLGGFVPREATLVCDRRYGDCKDMSSLLYHMINSVGLKAYYTWIGTRDIPYTYNEVPTPKVDNHMICTYFNGTDYIFLDATGNNAFGTPTAFIQGKQALIGLSENEYELMFVPIIAAHKNTTADTVSVTIENELVTGKGKITYTGYEASNIRPYLQNFDANGLKKYYERSFKKGNNKSKATGLGIENLADKDLPLIVNYAFDIPDYLNNFEDEVYFNPFLKKYLANGTIKIESNTLAKKNSYQQSKTTIVYIDVPDDLSVVYLSEGSSYTYDKFSFSITYHYDTTKKRIEVSTEFTINYTVLNPDEFVKWNEFTKKLNQAYSEVIAFKKI